MTPTPHSLLQNVGTLYRIAVLVGLRPEANLQAISNAMQEADWPSTLKRKDRDELQKLLPAIINDCRTLGFIAEMGPKYLQCAYVLVPAALSWATVPRFLHFAQVLCGESLQRIAGFDRVHGLATTKRTLVDRERKELSELGLTDEYLQNEATMMDGLWLALKEGKLPGTPPVLTQYVMGYETVATETGSSTEATLQAWLDRKKPEPGAVALFTQQPYGPRLEVEANAVLGPQYPCTVFAAGRCDPLVAGLMSEVSKLLHWLLTH